MRVLPDCGPLCRRGSVRVWSADAGGNPSDGDRDAEHAVAADRFAHKIVGFLAVCAALAAAERQPVGPPALNPLPFKRGKMRSVYSGTRSIKARACLGD